MSTRDKFNLHGERLPTTSSFALYVDPYTEGKQEIVQAEGTLMDEHARRVDHTHDRGHLACLHCSVPMHYVPFKHSTSGSTGDRDVGYFAPNGSHDETCLLLDPEAVHNFTLLDTTKGPRININTADFSKDFTQAVGVYEWRGRKKYLLDDNLLDREVKDVTDASQILKLIDTYVRGGKNDKLLAARFVFQNNAQDWDQTVIPLGKASRHAGLVNRVMERPAGAEPPYAMVEIKTTAPHDARSILRDPENKKSGWKIPPAPVEPIEIGVMKNGAKVFVQYAIYLDSREKGLQQYGMSQAGSYFVMGEVRGNHFHDFPGEGDDPGHRTYYLNIKVTDYRQLVMKSTEGILEQLAGPRPRRTRAPALQFDGTDMGSLD